MNIAGNAKIAKIQIGTAIAAWNFEAERNGQQNGKIESANKGIRDPNNSLGIVKKEKLHELLQEARELTAIFNASRQTAKQRR
jgi:hypothetical protein